MSFSVLVLDAAQRSALAVTRSLGKIEGVRITTAEAAPVALAGQSVYSSHYLCYPAPQNEPLAFLEWIKKLLDTNRFDLVVPTTEIVSQLLLMHSDAMSASSIPFASYEQVMALADKGKLVELALQVGVPVPRSMHYDSARALDYSALSFPLVIKPCLSKIFVGSNWISTRVKVLQSVEALQLEIQQSPYLMEHAFMLQEFIPGHGAGIFALYNQGRAVAFFSHQRIGENPPQGGVSVVSESAAVDPRLESYARQLLDAQKWHGVAMIEFRVATDGTPYLMEVNTRFWGSLQLAIDAGVDFPKLLFQAAMHLPVEIPASYQVGCRLRWLLGDVDSLYLYLRSSYSIKQKIIRVLQFILPSRHRTRHEVNRWNDLGPALFELKSYLKHALGKP